MEALGRNGLHFLNPIHNIGKVCKKTCPKAVAEIFKAFLKTLLCLAIVPPLVCGVMVLVGRCCLQNKKEIEVVNSTSEPLDQEKRAKAFFELLEQYAVGKWEEIKPMGQFNVIIQKCPSEDLITYKIITKDGHRDRCEFYYDSNSCRFSVKAATCAIEIDENQTVEAFVKKVDQATDGWGSDKAPLLGKSEQIVVKKRRSIDSVDVFIDKKVNEKLASEEFEKKLKEMLGLKYTDRN